MTNRLCKDCKFSTRFRAYVSEFASFPSCARPDPYTGFPIRTSLDDERAGLGLFGRCGPKGRYFEPKETETENLRTFDEYYNTYCDEVYGVGGIGSSTKAVRAVLDLAGVKYREG